MGLVGGQFVLFMSLLFILQPSHSVDFDTNSDGPNDDGRADGGGTVLWQQRGTIKALNFRSMDHHVANRTINLNSFKLDRDYMDSLSQHPAYQLPLQQLSNKQISYLIKKYSNKDVSTKKHLKRMNRTEKIDMLEEMIAERAKTRIIKPVLLSHVDRILPDDLSIQPEPLINESKRERTTISPLVKQIKMSPVMLIETVNSKYDNRTNDEFKSYVAKNVHRERDNFQSARTEPQPETNQDEITTTTTESIQPETTEPMNLAFKLDPPNPIDYEKTLDISPMKSTSGEQLREISLTLRQMKEKYDAMKLKFLRRLRELNERKVKLAKRRKLNNLSSKYPTSSYNSLLAVNHGDEAVINLDNQGISNTASESGNVEVLRRTSKIENLEKQENSHMRSSFDTSYEHDIRIPVSKTILPDEINQERPEKAHVEATTGNAYAQDSVHTYEDGPKVVPNLHVVRPLKFRTRVHSSKITSVKIPLDSVSRSGHFPKSSDQETRQEEVIPLIRKQESEISPLNEFEEVVFSSPRPLVKFSNPNASTHGSNANAYALPGKMALVKYSTSFVRFEQPQPEAVRAVFVPRAKLPPPKDEIVQEFLETTTTAIEEVGQTTVVPYLRDGDVITKTRQDEKTSPSENWNEELSTEQTQSPYVVDRDTNLNQGFESIPIVLPTNEEKNKTEFELMNHLEKEFDRTALKSNILLQQTNQTIQAKANGVITVNHAEVDPNLLKEEFAETDEEAICDAIACDFEKESLCEWEASIDLLSPASRHYIMLKRMHRNKRRTHYVQRTWHNWRGRYRNRVTGIARARVFSPDNQRFAAAYVRPYQRATLTGKILSREKVTIRFRAWEATRNVQLRVCCDTMENCVFETDLGIKRGTRRWIVYNATCPAGTNKLIFECVNHGVYQGACGLDDIYLSNDYCPKLFPLDEQRKRKKVI